VPIFHGYSASGNVTASFVYVNYGTYQDYEDLVDAKIDMKGKIAIARYGGIFRGLKVKRAQELGFEGILIYSDPGDDGERTEENGYKPYPEGPARNPSAVQRGSAEFLSIRPGDPYVSQSSKLDSTDFLDLPLAIPPSPVFLELQSTMLLLTFLLSPSHIVMRFLSSRL
jgi:hypothetical protein